MSRRNLTLWFVVFSLMTACAQTSWAQPTGPVPDPPGTGPFAIQFFVGGTSYTYMTVNLPTTYDTGAPIPPGTAVQIKIYRWDWTTAVWNAVALESGTGTGPYGSGGAGIVGTNTFVSFIAITPVDCIEPRVIVLAATAVVGGVESIMVTDDLSFRYAAAPAEPAIPADKDCVPTLIRFSTPAGALPPGVALPPPPPGGPLGPGKKIKPTVSGTRIDIKTGAAGSLDLIFVIDQTSSMSSVFAQVQKTAKQIMASIAGAYPDYRVAIVAYRDWGDTEMFKDFPFTTSVGEFQAAIDSLKAQGGGDTPEAVLEALLRALRMPWRDGVNKQIILMGDAPPHSPVPQGPDAGKTAADVAKLAFEVDPAVINTIATSVGGVVPKDTLTAFEDLAARTKGAAVTADKAEEVPKKIMDVVGTIAGPSASSVGGGGGAPVLPATGVETPMIIAVVLLGGCLLMFVAIVIVRQRGTTPGARGAAGPKVNAGLSMTFADGRTTSFRITGTRTTIGRGEDNVLVVRDGETSTHHAEIVASRERFRLRDVGSANGTTVNGQPVTDVDLRVGDEIGIGTVRLTFTQ